MLVVILLFFATLVTPSPIFLNAPTAPLLPHTPHTPNTPTRPTAPATPATPAKPYSPAKPVTPTAPIKPNYKSKPPTNEPKTAWKEDMKKKIKKMAIKAGAESHSVSNAKMVSKNRNTNKAVVAHTVIDSQVAPISAENYNIALDKSVTNDNNMDTTLNSINNVNFSNSNRQPF